MEIEKIIQVTFEEICSVSNRPVVSHLSRETILLQSGLDSLGFAILVARLEEILGYDPFLLMDQPIYPQTFGEFVDIYKQFNPTE